MNATSERWIEGGAKCLAYVKGETYDGIILTTDERRRRATVKIAVPIPLSGQIRVVTHPDPIGYNRLSMRESHVPGLDEAPQRKGA